MDPKEVFLTIVYPSVGGEYGFDLDGSHAPLRVSLVLPESPAAKAGLQKQDLLVMVNGHDVSKMSLTKVQSIISYCRQSPITIKVLRYQENEVNHSGHSKQDAVNSYKETVEDAFKSALDAVSILSDDLSFQKPEVSKDNRDDDGAPCIPPTHTVEKQGVRESDPLEDSSDSVFTEQAALVSNLMKAQHGLRDIIDNASQSTSKKKGKTLISTEASISVTSNRHITATKVARSTSPPPIPPYKPESPDRFLLSNKPEYQLEVKRQRHYYEDVELDQESSLPRGPKLPLLNLEKKTTLPTTESKQDHLPKAEFPVDPLRANKGLPNSVHSWKMEHVMKWLQQLSPSLCDSYKDYFLHHNITGHTLVHLNQSKLQSMGVTDREDRMQLGMSIARLRLNHEHKELEKLADQVSWL